MFFFVSYSFSIVCLQFSFLCAVNFPQNSFLRYLQQPLKLAIFMSLFINQETVRAGKQESWPLTHGYTTQVPPVTLHGSVKLTNTKKVNVQAWDSPGSHLTEAQNLKSNVKKCHFNSPIFFLKKLLFMQSGRCRSFLKNFDKLQAPFRNMKGSQQDLVILNINTKPFRTIQYNLILYGAPFK